MRAAPVGMENGGCPGQVERRSFADRDATNAITRFRPDVALIDVNMPFLSGDQLVQLLAKQRATKHVRVILFSSNDEASLRALALTCGAAGFISKSALGGGFAESVASFCQEARKWAPSD